MQLYRLSGFLPVEIQLLTHMFELKQYFFYGVVILVFLWRCDPTRAIATPLLIFQITQNGSPQSIGILWKCGQPTQRPAPDNTRHARQADIPIPRRDSNSQSQQASGRRLTPQTARPLGMASVVKFYSYQMYIDFHVMINFVISSFQIQAVLYL